MDSGLLRSMVEKPSSIEEKPFNLPYSLLLASRPKPLMIMLLPLFIHTVACQICFMLVTCLSYICCIGSSSCSSGACLTIIDLLLTC